jgi:hypothetical protein
LVGSPLLEQLALVLSTGEVTTLETNSEVTPDRRFIYRIMPYPGGVALTSKNITERHRLRQAAVESEALHAALCAHSDVGFARLDEHMRFGYVTATFASWLDRDVEVVLGTPVDDLITPGDRVHAHTALQGCLEGTPDDALDLTFHAGRSGNIRLRLSVAPIVRAGATPSGIAIVAAQIHTL